MNTKSDTPETDAAEPRIETARGGWVRADFARRLERERDEREQDAKKLREFSREIEADRVRLITENKRLTDQTSPGYVFNQMRKAWEALGHNDRWAFRPHKLVDSVKELLAERDQLRAQLAARDEALKVAWDALREIEGDFQNPPNNYP